MTEEESAILEFLRASPEVYFARREIARKAMSRRIFEEDNNWANVPLANLVDRKEVEQDQTGCYRYKSPR